MKREDEHNGNKEDFKECIREAETRFIITFSPLLGDKFNSYPTWREEKGPLVFIHCLMGRMFNVH